MKKNVYFFIVGSMLFLLQNTNAQINLLHTFNESVNWTGNLYTEQNLFPFSSYSITNVVNNSFVVKIYNADFSVISNNTYNFTPPAGYTVSYVYMSRKIYNSDNNYEFWVIYSRTDEIYDNTRQRGILYNQNGTIIKDFGSAYLILPSILHVVGNNLRLSLLKYYYNGTSMTTKTEIYSVPGIPSGIADLKSSEFQAPYPNPATSIITLPYQLKQGEMSVMRIYNANGQLIETKKIDSVFDEILLDVSHYTKGLYLYEVNGISNKFIVD